MYSTHQCYITQHTRTSMRKSKKSSLFFREAHKNMQFWKQRKHEFLFPNVVPYSTCLLCIADICRMQEEYLCNIPNLHNHKRPRKTSKFLTNLYFYAQRYTLFINVQCPDSMCTTVLAQGTWTARVQSKVTKEYSYTSKFLDYWIENRKCI